MDAIATTRLSSKGQVVIPEEVRKRLGLEAGVQFIVVGEGDVVVLKVVTPPAGSQFRGLLAKARRQARKAGMKRSDIAGAVKRVRGKR